MNIFILDKNPILVARYHCDKHVVKMVLETAQILSTVLSKYDIGTEYKPTHPNHPCNIWAAENSYNLLFTAKIGIALANEYTFRYGKVHKSERIIRDCVDNKLIWKRIDNSNYHTNFPLAMPDEFKVGDKTIEQCIESYRNYYKSKKETIQFKYTNREQPLWL